MHMTYGKSPRQSYPEQWLLFGRRGADEMSHAWIGMTHMNEE
jgi:hypothetical protein